MKQSIYQFYRRALLCYPGFVILFYIVSVPVWLYLAILDTVLLLTCLLYINSDAEFFSTVTQDSFWGNLAFLTAKFLHHRSLRWFSDQELWFATILLVLEFFVLSLSLSPLGEKPEFPPIEMFKEQRQDVDRLRRYIMDLPLMGINAKWGNGKSLIWAKLKEDPVIQENFEIIQIDLLACNLDSVELILLDQLEHILEQHGIYPKSSRHLKALLGQNKWTNWIGSVLGLDKSSLSASFDSLQKDLYCMSKKVLIGFEDIDRISDKDSIKKIFAISEKLASEQVHIVFQYNEDLLADVGLDHQYLEKYIPHTVTLTEMSYVGLVFDLWRVLEMRSCPINVLELVDMDFPDYAEKSANQLLGQYSTSRFTSYYWNPSIRSVRAYLLDLKRSEEHV